MTRQHNGQVTVGDVRAVLNDDWSTTVYVRISETADKREHWLRRAWFVYDIDFCNWCIASGVPELYERVTELHEAARVKLRQRITAREEIRKAGRVL